MVTAHAGPDTRELRGALVAEVSGLAENVQEVCGMIRADTAQLAHTAAAAGRARLPAQARA